MAQMIKKLRKGKDFIISYTRMKRIKENQTNAMKVLDERQ